MCRGFNTLLVLRKIETHSYCCVRSIVLIFFFLDQLAHVVIPLHPKLKPHARMLHHFRFLNPLLPKDEDGISPLHYYDSAVQLARNSARALTEEEFELGITAASQIEKWFVIFLLADMDYHAHERPPV
jgi:hypothetical protein